MNSSRIRPLKETGEHSYHRRSFSHNYFAPFIYHIILNKAEDCEPFGTLTGDARIAPGNPGCASIKETELGKTISKGILHLHYEIPVIKLLQFCVMPDHVHLLIQVLCTTDKHLDFYIDALRNRIATRYSLLRGMTINDQDIFLPGYCDKPLYDKRSLDGLFRYIRENPHRLAMRRQYPQFFRRVRELKIGERGFEAYGNLFLLRNPDKAAVKISRSFSPAEKADKRAAWVSAASKGTVLVSPFISGDEKAIRAEAEQAGAAIILITGPAFVTRYKPAQHDFDLCCRGRLLIISLGLPASTPLSRALCLEMNTLASEIALEMA